MRRRVTISTGLCIFFLTSTVCFAQHRLEIVPSIAVAERYDDNILLSSSQEISDYITTVSPGIRVGVVGQFTHLDLRYQPTFVWYNDRSDLDSTRHSAKLNWGQQVAEHLSFDLANNYLKSDDPLEDPLDPQGLRTTRNRYWRNTGEARANYVFGEENRMSLGFGQSYLKNSDPTIDDGRINRPLGSITFWFNTANGVELDYQYTDAKFWKDQGPAGDNYTGDAAGLKYIRRFSENSQAFASYSFTQRDFEGATQDYDVHTATAGWDHSFSRDFSISLGSGYFVQKKDGSPDEKGYVYNALLSKIFEKGKFVIGGAGGWDEAYLQAQRRGFTRYWSGKSRIDYQALESIGVYGEGSFTVSRDSTNREWNTTRADCGISWSFLRWFSLALNYAYAKRNDDVSSNDYTDNRVALILTASKLYVK